MKHLLILLAAATALFAVSCVGEYDNIDKYAGEIVYPAAFDTIVAHVGFERVELDLWQAGRVSAAEMKLGKAKRTIVEYDGNKYPIDEIRSWVNVTGLTESKLYRIKVYTEDEYGNYSVPQTATAIPFTSLDRDLIEFAPPRLSLSSSSLIAEWSLSTLNSVISEYHGMSWRYTDGAGQTQTGSTTGTRFFAANFPISSMARIDITYKIVPILSSGAKILDTLYVTVPLEVQLPTATTPFSPAERTILVANGITTFTPAAISTVTSLTYPLHTTSFADLFYFPNLRTLDLTGAGLQNVLPVLTYARNSAITSCGGGAWQPFMRRVEKPADMRISNTATLADLLESGQLTKVRYIPGTMGLDDLFAPYVSSGVVELVADNDPIFPDVVHLDPQCFVKGIVVDNNFNMDNFYSGDFLPRSGYTDIGKFDPLNETVNGDRIDMHLDQLTPSQRDGKNIYKCVIRMRSASFAMNLPREYMYDSRRYRYLKFKMFCGTAAEDMSGANAPFLAPWIRPMNHMWSAFASNSIYGMENWDVTLSSIPNSDIRNNWVEYTVDMNANNWWGSNINTTDNGTGNRRNRVIVFNIGHEPGNAYNYDANKQVAIYVADIRLSKTP